MARSLYRPDPILRHQARPIDRTTPPAQAAARLRAGERLILTDAFSTGVSILGQLRVLMPAPAEGAGYVARRAHRRAWREASEHLLAPITGHQIALSAAPEIGFIPQLYPDHRSFALPFADVQALSNAWTWYDRGVHLAVLGHRVHPFYGTYAPARTSHLELFATWLSQHKGPRGRAIDVGTGCGVLALMLCKAGYSDVLATDCNPNAIESVQRELLRLPSRPPLTLRHGDLLGGTTKRVDLVVFNPPWTKGEVESPLDRALYFDDEKIFERFFDQASVQLTPKGRVVVLFSNIMELVQPDVPHPLKVELERGRFKLVQKLTRKVKPPSRDGRKRKTRERVEIWEFEIV